MKNMLKLAIVVLALAAAAGLTACKKKQVVEGKKPAAPPPAELTQVRNAIQAYYADNEGKYPGNLNELVGEGKYLKELPKVKSSGCAASGAVKYIQAKALAPENLDDAGGFAYYNSEKYPETRGALVLNCKQKNDEGIPACNY